MVTGFRTAALEQDGARTTLVAQDGRRVVVDRVVAVTGFRPDHAWLAQVHLDLDGELSAPRDLAPEIHPAFHSCGTVSPHGAALLRQPEGGLYLVGMKSYGRAPSFLALTGYEQVRSVVAEVAGDHEAASRVDLVLPGAVPVAELVPELARSVGLLDPLTVHGGYTVTGPDGRRLSGDAGLVLQGPNVVYPAHVHKATEIYWVASGTADWQKGDDWSSHGPGTAIFHDTGVRHATVTGDEPTLMLFAWVTDPACVPVIIRL